MPSFSQTLPRLGHACLVTLCLLCGTARADNTELNDMVERNAVSAGHGRLCNEDPLAEQLKSATMLVLALSGIPSENVQLGSAKFTDMMRREMYDRRKEKDFQCKQHIAVAQDRLDHAHRLARELRAATIAPSPEGAPRN